MMTRTACALSHLQNIVIHPWMHCNWLGVGEFEFFCNFCFARAWLELSFLSQPGSERCHLSSFLRFSLILPALWLWSFHQLAAEIYVWANKYDYLVYQYLRHFYLYAYHLTCVYSKTSPRLQIYLIWYCLRISDLWFAYCNGWILFVAFILWRIMHTHAQMSFSF